MKFFYFIIVFMFYALRVDCQSIYENPIPYSTDTSNLTIWNGSEYIPFFIKGMNLGVATPGTFPGELAATKEQYVKWFKTIKEAGFNTIRLYTLHYPRFYEALNSFNQANRHNPLLFFQGVWLNEHLPNYQNNLFFLTDTFRVEIKENINAVHGNISIPVRQGKAFGTYSENASDWCLGYIIGREIHPPEILTTNSQNTGINTFSGNHFSINNASASEVWLTSMLDYLVDYEWQNYGKQRPVSASSWPTLDPLDHPEEVNDYEDSAELDLSKIQRIDAPAGFFISYHAYPYYPDFVSVQSSYQDYYDSYGPNSYLGYLTELRNHYRGVPLIIAEYGVPSSWATAHYASSGMNHGGFNELSQGITNIRMLNTFQEAHCGGGIQFAWIDEWFKRTWVTDPVDYNPEDRVLWHNIASAEQNYGLISFEKQPSFQTLKQFDQSSPITYINADANYTFFEMEIGLNNPLDNPDELWVAFDTYDENLGESILPSGFTIPNFRSEFALHITNHSAHLHVTQAYDIFGVWHGVSSPEQVFRSIPTDGAPWYIVRLKNNYSHSDVQYIGNLSVRQGYLPSESTDAVHIFDNRIRIRIPWSYINVVAPNQSKVLHATTDLQVADTISEGFAISVLYKNNWFQTDTRYSWDTWNFVDPNSLTERYKTSYWVMYDQLHNFNTPPIAIRDTFVFIDENFPVTIDASNGLLQNDFDLDGESLYAFVTKSPRHGHVDLFTDGGFSYYPDQSFAGYDSIQYLVFDGYSLSTPNYAVLFVEKNTSTVPFISQKKKTLSVYPNPASNYINLESKQKVISFKVFNEQGVLIESIMVNDYAHTFSVQHYKLGIYILIAKVNDEYLSTKFIKK